MSRVKILPEILSNKIAAGEVVERPASVVKELVENALDAGSSRILITLENAGKSLIRVSDNGCGMGRDDALLSIERYATSKIATDKDLFSIATLGFRGEALPSIASVSKFSLESREKASESGVRVEVEGGKLVSVTDAGLPVGTQITVAHLFYNIPVRRKFLKTNDTELGHVVDTVASIALAWPGTQFQLVHNGKPLKIWPAVEETSSRIVDVAGKDLEKGLFPVSFSQGGVSLTGWLASGRTVRSTPKGIYLYVNSRFVRDSVVRQGLLAGFAGKLLTGRFPVAVLFLTVPPDQVDVNVHPTKHQVRFVDPRGIHRLVETAVSETLRVLDRPFSSAPPVSEPAISEERADFGSRVSWAPTFSEDSDPAPPAAVFSPEPVIPEDVLAPKSIPEGVAAPEQRAVFPSAPAPRPLPVAETVQQPLFPKKKAFENLTIIGQLHDTYLVCESPREGMILIDQHAAHERILFEKLGTRGTPETQRLLLPETLELGFSEASILEGMLPDLAEFGFDVEPFGGNTFVVKAAPSLLAGREIAPLIVEMVEKSAETGVLPELAEPLDRVRQLIACHGAIRANQRLSPEQMKGLLTALDACHTPGTCPHGRPTWIEWRIPAIEKAFFRVI